jgi:hypothetical protein
MSGAAGPRRSGGLRGPVVRTGPVRRFPIGRVGHLCGGACSFTVFWVLRAGCSPSPFRLPFIR